MADLAGKAVTAVLWGTGGSVLRIVLQLLAQAVLARLLGPGEYGVFAIGSVVVAFSSFIADVGLAYGLIQKKHVTDADVRFAFTWQFILGVLVSVSLVTAADALAAFFKEPRAADVLRVMSLICLVNAVTAPAASLLKRRLDFKTQQIGFLASYFFGFVVVGIPLALHGAGVWSLVAAWASQSLVMAVTLYAHVRHPIRPLFWYGQGAAQGKYSVTVLATNLLNWIIGNVDRVVVGRLLPTQAIGLYATVYNFIYVPTASVLSILQPVLFATTARAAEGDEDAAPAVERLERGLCAVVAAVGLYLLPVFACAAMLADELVLVMYGPAWGGAAVILRPLALAMPFFLLWGLCTPVLWTGGHPRGEFLAQLPIAMAWGAACWVLATTGGAEAVAWGVVLLFVARSLVLAGMLHRKVGVRWSQLLLALRGGVLMTLVLALVVASIRWCSLTLPPASRLALAVLAGIIMFVILLRLLPGLVRPELGALTRRVLERLPAAWQSRLRWLCGAY